jgi:hypothetical protein
MSNPYDRTGGHTDKGFVHGDDYASPVRPAGRAGGVRSDLRGRVDDPRPIARGTRDMTIELIHSYVCDVCGEPYTVRHKDEATYEDECPTCGCVDNVPTDIFGAPGNEV